MKLHQLKYFVAVCDCGSFTRASAQLFIAQPSLSQQIRALEDSMGVRLLERIPRGVRPTAAGAALLPDARAILAIAERARMAVRNASDGVARQLTVMSVRSVASNVLPAAISFWHDQYPHTPIGLKDFNHHRLLEEATFAQEGDVAIGPRPNEWKGPVLSLGYEEVLLIGRDLGGVPVESLSEVDWVLFEPDHGMSDVISLFCEKNGINPRVVARSAQVEAALMLSLSGMGVTMLPENAVPLALRSACTLRAGSGLFRELVAYCLPDPPTHVQRFIHTLVSLDLGLHRHIDPALNALLC